MAARPDRPFRGRQGKLGEAGEELIAFARHVFRLAEARGDVTLREHLEAVERQTGRRPRDLDGPPLPDCVAHVWSWWQDLHVARGGTGFGPAPIGWQDVAAWSALTGTITRPAEIRLLMDIDRAWLEAQADVQRKRARP